MAYLTPEIEAFSNSSNDSSLVRTNISCGIFQDCDYNEERPKPYPQQTTENTKD
jgi:hypothetical protein